MPTKGSEEGARMRPATRKIRPPLKWHGGKHYLAGKIISLFLNHRVYCEPYCGGLSVLLGKWRAPLEVCGDINPDLIHFHTCLRDRPEELIKRLSTIPYAKQSFEWACQAITDPDPIERVVRFMVANRMSRGGLMRDFAWSERKRGGRPGDENAWRTLMKELPFIAQRLTGVEFYESDGVDLIKRFDSSDTLIYCDPPYVQSTRSARDAYSHEMTDQAHLRLLDTITSVRAMVVISGYDNQIYNRALHSWERIEIEMPNNSGQTKVKRRRTEVLWASPGCDRFELRG
jgi:DNA adenine methylase